MSTGSGNFVGWLPLSENPSTDIATAVTLYLTMISRKSRSARYAVCGSDFTFLRFIRVWSENSVQTSASRIQCVWSEPLGQLETVIKTLSQQRQSFHVLVALEMAMRIIVDSCGILFFIDSHIHGTKGAVIARFNPDSHCQAQNFAVWLDQMLIHTKK